MGRVRIWTSLLVAAALAVGCITAAHADTRSPATTRGGNGFVKHSGPNWVWFGPGNWDAAYGAYGLTIFGTGGSSIDYGGSSTICNGTPAQWFKQRRRAFASNPSLSQVKFSKISRIRTNRPFNQGGTAAQTMDFKARANGTKIGGQLGFQYALYIYDPSYCYQAQLFKGAKDDRDFKSSMRTVEAVWDRTAYSGPGLPINPSTGLP